MEPTPSHETVRSIERFVHSTIDEQLAPILKIKDGQFRYIETVYECVFYAARSAVAIASSSRDPTKIAADEFVRHHMSMRAYIARMAWIDDDSEGFFRFAWPQHRGVDSVPLGVEFGIVSGLSALHAAWLFTDRIFHTAVSMIGYDIRDAIESPGGDDIVVSPQSDPRIIQWRDKTLHELDARTLDPKWSSWDIGRDFQTLEYKLLEEDRIAWEIYREPDAESDTWQLSGKTKNVKRAPMQCLKEARERHAAKEIAKEPNITCVKLAKILGCHRSTVVRLEAWKKRGVLAYPEPPKGYRKQSKDRNKADIESIDESQ